MDKGSNKHDTYDMIVIGAGISGLAIAFEAQQAGINVLVLGCTGAGKTTLLRQLKRA